MSSKLGIIASNQGKAGKVLVKGRAVGVRPTHLKRATIKSMPVEKANSIKSARVVMRGVSGQIAGRAELINKVGAIVKSNEGAVISSSNRQSLDQLFATLD